MSLTLVRLDDRLIHGQVVVGWGHALDIDRILLIDDRVSGSDWERELYRLGVPPGMEVEFSSVAGATDILEEWMSAPQRTIVIVADVDTLARVCHANDAVQKVNIGGVHERDDRKRRLPYVFLSDDELAVLRSISESGVEVTAQDLPSTRPVPLAEMA